MFPDSFKSGYLHLPFGKDSKKLKRLQRASVAAVSAKSQAVRDGQTDFRVPGGLAKMSFVLGKIANKGRRSRDLRPWTLRGQ